MKKIAIVFVTVLLTISANAECKPKWCSGKQLSNYTEATICEHPILWATDATLSSIYKELIGYKGQKGHHGNWYKEVKDTQKSWLKERNKLSKKNSILDSYMKRIDTLYGHLKEQINIEKRLPYQNIEKIYQSIVDNNPERLANLITFPKNIVISGKDTKFASKAEFIEKYPTIFTKEYREEIAKEKPTPDMFSNYQGIMLGDGVVWFTEDGHLQSLNK
jgi:uncharacterized protein